ncbi:MAG: hypothetical protein R3B89_18625 [Polyangiaceae bacterium]
MSRVTTFLAASIASGALALATPALAAGHQQDSKPHPVAKSSPKKAGKPHAAGKQKQRPASKPKQNAK